MSILPEQNSVSDPTETLGDTSIAEDLDSLTDFMVRSQNREFSGRGLWRCASAGRPTFSFSMARPVNERRYASANGQLVSSVFADEIGRIALRWWASGNDSLFIEYLLSDEQFASAQEPGGTRDGLAFPVQKFVRDDMTSVRLGPAARWQGYSSLYDGVYVCEPTEQLQD